MTPQAPEQRTTADFLPGLSGERVRRTLTVHDLTEAAGHDNDTQLYHITFGDEDHDDALAVLRGMSENFLDFYTQLQEATDDKGNALPLPLPLSPAEREAEPK